MRAAAATFYVLVMLGVVVLFNAGFVEAQLIWLVASFCLGWMARDPWLAFLPLLASPIAMPFGYADEGTLGDPLMLWSEVLLAAPIQGAFVIAGFSGHLLYERFRASRA
jgi:hypothetical protein